MQFLDGNIVQIDPPKSPKKITGTKFASVLGLNPYQTRFGAWVDLSFSYDYMTHKETPQRLAGRILEPKIIEYLKQRYGMRIRGPSEAIGLDCSQRHCIDLYPQNQIFGGIWDALGPDYIVEIKTTGNTKNWKIENGRLISGPISAYLQGALYAYLCDYDKVVIALTSLKKSDYPIRTENGFNTTTTDTLILSDQNTFVGTFLISKTFPNFVAQYLQPSVNFWYQYVQTGISPPYDPDRDAKLLRLIQRA